MDSPVKHCPNQDCLHFEKVGKAAVYRYEVKICPDCGTPLENGAPASPALSAESSDIRHYDGPLVVVQNFREPYLARLAKSKLESEGIFSFIRDEHMIDMSYLYSHKEGGVKLEVPEPHAKRAREILDTDSSYAVEDAYADEEPFEE
ncbi:hypothetical protein ACFLU6_06655 [Acidobacteriota bacterium]